MANIQQKGDGSTSLYSDIEGLDLARFGGPKTPAAATVGLGSAKYRGATVAVVPLSAAAGNGGVLAWRPDRNDIDHIIGQVVIDITTLQAGQTASFGTATNATTSSANLIDTLAISATGQFDNITDKSTNGKSRQRLVAGQYITGTASGTPASLVGYAYITYWPVA